MFADASSVTSTKKVSVLLTRLIATIGFERTNLKQDLARLHPTIRPFIAASKEQKQRQAGPVLCVLVYVWGSRCLDTFERLHQQD
jgi:hypothetical protein